MTCTSVSFTFLFYIPYLFIWTVLFVLLNPVWPAVDELLTLLHKVWDVEFFDSELLE